MTKGIICSLVLLGLVSCSDIYFAEPQPNHIQKSDKVDGALEGLYLLEAEDQSKSQLLNLEFVEIIINNECNKITFQSYAGDYLNSTLDSLMSYDLLKKSSDYKSSFPIIGFVNDKKVELELVADKFVINKIPIDQEVDISIDLNLCVMTEGNKSTEIVWKEDIGIYYLNRKIDPPQSTNIESYYETIYISQLSKNTIEIGIFDFDIKDVKDHIKLKPAREITNSFGTIYPVYKPKPSQFFTLKDNYVYQTISLKKIR